MIDTGGTLIKAVNMIKSQGAKRIFCFATHGLFSGEALSNLDKSLLDEIIITNTIP
jgi:ribose-phosphate pyrophosphokinase